MAAESGMDIRYHLYTDLKWNSVSCDDYRCVFEESAFVAALEYDGCKLLCRSLGRSNAHLWNPMYFQ